MNHNMHEPCLCGADDCPLCYPLTWDDIEDEARDDGEPDMQDEPADWGSP